MLNKLLPFLPLLFLSSLGLAQNWQPFPKNDSIRQYYHPDTTVVNWIGDKQPNQFIQTLVVDTNYASNGVNIKVFKKGYSLVEVLKDRSTSNILGRLLGDSLFTYSDSSIFISSSQTINKLIFPHQYQIGLSWQFGEGSIRIRATVDSIQLKNIPFFGSDSVAFITLNVFDLNNNPFPTHRFNSQLEISKSNGIIKQVDFLANSKKHYFHLFKWEGKVILESESKDFGAGDIVVVFNESIGGGSRDGGITTTVTKYEVINQSINSQSKIIEYSTKLWLRRELSERGVTVLDTIHPIESKLTTDTLSKSKIYAYKYSGILNITNNSITNYYSMYSYNQSYLPDSIIKIRHPIRFDLSSYTAQYTSTDTNFSFIKSNGADVIGSFGQSFFRLSSSYSQTKVERIIYSKKGSSPLYQSNTFNCDSIKPIIDSGTISIVPKNLMQYYVLIDSSLINIQWLDCQNNYAPIIDSTSASFTPRNAGSYAARVEWANGCVDTSYCVQLVNLVDLNKSKEQISLYPNPSSTIIYLSPGVRTENVQIFGITSELMIEKNGIISELDVSTLPAGVYLIRVLTETGKVLTQKFVKQ